MIVMAFKLVLLCTSYQITRQLNFKMHKKISNAATFGHSLRLRCTMNYIELEPQLNFTPRQITRAGRSSFVRLLRNGPISSQGCHQTW